MKKLEETYGDRFFKKRKSLSWRADYVCPAIIDSYKEVFGRPLESIIDVGCAIGDYVKKFKDLGIIADGIEGSEAVKPYLVVSENYVSFYDLREPILMYYRDLVICFEVLEHIEPKYAMMLINNLIRLSNIVLVSAAPPGQGGVGHVNCQEQRYWISLFGAFGYRYNTKMVKTVREKWLPVKHKKEMRAYYNNLMCFIKE